MEIYQTLSSELLLIRIHTFSDSFSGFKNNAERLALEINLAKLQLKADLAALINECTANGVISLNEIEKAKMHSSSLVVKFLLAVRRTEKNL